MTSLTTTCSTCSTILNPADQWCPECGTAVALLAPKPQSCPSCSEPADQDDEWCSSCGTRLITTVEVIVSPSEAAPEAPTVAEEPPTPASLSPTMLLRPIGGAKADVPMPMPALASVTEQATGTSPNFQFTPPSDGSSETGSDKTARRGWNSILNCQICEGCFAQDVKDAPTCYKCGARFLTPEEIAAIEAEEAKTDLERAREQAQVTLSGAGAKVATARETFHAVSGEALQAAAHTRAGRNLKDYWVGWALVAASLLVGAVALKVVVGARQSKTGLRQTVTTVPALPPQETWTPPPSVNTPTQPTGTGWSGAYNLDADARQRSRTNGWGNGLPNSTSEQGVRLPLVPPMNLPTANSGPDLAAMQRQQEQQMRDMQARTQQMQAHQKQQLEQLQRQAEANQMVQWHCTRCNAKQFLPKSVDEPQREAGKGTCIDLYGGASPGGHSWTYGGPVR